MDWKQRLEALPVIFPFNGLSEEEVIEETKDGLKIMATHEYFFLEDINVFHVSVSSESSVKPGSITRELIESLGEPYIKSDVEGVTHMFWHSPNPNVPLTSIEKCLGKDKVEEVAKQAGLGPDGMKELLNIIRANESLPAFDMSAKVALVPIAARIPSNRRMKVLLTYEQLTMAVFTERNATARKDRMN